MGSDYWPLVQVESEPDTGIDLERIPASLLRKPFSVQSLLTHIEQQLRRGERWRGQDLPEGSCRE